MSKQTRFARAFEPWIAAWSRMKLSGTQERVLLLLMAGMERDANGAYTAWRPRREIADILGLSENTVREAIQALKRKGIIEPIGPSHAKCCQRYKIMPRKKGGLQTPPIIEKGWSTGSKKGGLSPSKRVVSTDHPTRSVEGDSPSLGRAVPHKTMSYESAIK